MRVENSHSLAWILAGLLFNAITATGEDVQSHARAAVPQQEIPTPLSASLAGNANVIGAVIMTSNTPQVELPPLPAGVTELKFSDFFRQPIGPRGLEYTEKLRDLEGRRVRILGHMVRQANPMERCFLLAPLPLTLHEDEYGYCDDLPAATLHVITPANAPTTIPFTPGLLLLTGTLSFGNRVEANGRVSTVRLELDELTSQQIELVKLANRTEAAAREAKEAAHGEHQGHHH